MPAKKKKAGRSRRKPYPTPPKKKPQTRPRRPTGSSVQKEIKMISDYLGQLATVLNTVNWVKLEAAGFEGPDGGGVPTWPPRRGDEDDDDSGDGK